MLGGKVTAIRTQWLEDLPRGRTRYVNEDAIGGPLEALVIRFLRVQHAGGLRIAWPRP